jgi:hypothetical protein
VSVDVVRGIWNVEQAVDDWTARAEALKGGRRSLSDGGQPV